MSESSPPPDPEPDAVADEPEPAAGAVADEPVEAASPRTEMALPPAVTGTSTATGAWMPDATPSAPAEVALAAGSDAAGAAVDSEPELVVSPRTLTAFPATVTGTLTEAAAWSPLRTPPIASGEMETDGAVGAAGAAAVEPVLVESPRTEIPLPAMDTGTVTPTTAWSPLATPSLGASAALAAAVPASHRPPTQRVNHIPLDTYLFMIKPFE
jgi:hypothetical protein